MNFSQYTHKSTAEAFDLLQSSEAGLSKKEADARLKKYGFNEFIQRKGFALTILKRQLKSPFFYLLVAAGLVSFLVGEKIDGLVIVLFVTVNVVIGFFQEYKAE